VELNQSDLAIVDVQLAESLGDPTEAAFTHGVLLYRQGDFDAALPYFDRYLKAYPEHWSGLGYRARILRKLGDNRGALADYEALIRLNDALNPGDYIAAARLMANLPGRGVDAALVLLDERVAKRGPVISLQRYAIELETGRGNYAAAIERMALLDQKLRATPQWQVDVAELMLLDGRGEEALSYLAVAQEQLAAGRKTAIHQQLIETARHLQERVMNSMQRADDGLEAQPPQS
jgi:tetratricopeptide (TPR) repeat protein